MYSTLDIVKVLKISRERLRDWQNRGYVKPSIQEASGQGTKAIFSVEDLYRIELMMQLVKSGHKREAASYLINAIDDKEISESFYLLRSSAPMKANPDLPGFTGHLDITLNVKDVRDKVNAALASAGFPVNSVSVEEKIGFDDTVSVFVERGGLKESVLRLLNSHPDGLNLVKIAEILDIADWRSLIPIFEELLEEHENIKFTVGEKQD